MSAKRIENDEQYEKAREWLVKTAQKADDPLSDVDAKTMRIYDMTSERMQEYRRGELVRMFPGLREVYQKLGYAFVELDAPEETRLSAEPEPESQLRPEPPTPPQREEKKSALSDWLDDD